MKTYVHKINHIKMFIVFSLKKVLCYCDFNLKCELELILNKKVKITINFAEIGRIFNNWHFSH